MLRFTLNLLSWVLIIIGPIAVIYTVYTGVGTALHDPSLPHDALWRYLFGQPG